jgi:hypothetical protein
MAHITADRVKDTTTTTGTGALTVSGTAPTGFRTFSAVCATSDTFYYAVQHQTANEWEVGLGTYSGTNEITRTTVLASSNAGAAVNFSAGTKDVFVTLAADKTVQQDGTGAVAIGANSTSAALRVTQTGTGNALVVEDSASPDATPFVVDANGRVLIGNPSPITVSGASAGIQATAVSGFVDSMRFSADANSSLIRFVKSRSNNVGTNTSVSSGDSVGILGFYAGDGTNYLATAFVTSAVDGTPGTNDMPGRITFSTTADGAASPTERMRIDNEGKVGIGGTPTAGRTLAISRNMTGGTSPYGVFAFGTIQSDATSQAVYFRSAAATAAAPFSTNITHYEAVQGTFGSGSTVNNQYGFIAGASLTGATNNYGFFSQIAEGTGRWNFYANGTAPNYFAGSVGIGTTTPGALLNVVANTSTDAVRITQTGTGNALVVEDSANPDSTPFVINTNGSAYFGAASTAGATSTGVTPDFQVVGTGANAGIANAKAATGLYRFFNDGSGPSTLFFKSRSATPGTFATVANGDELGNLFWQADDGTSFTRSARIHAQIDGVPGTNDVPGRLMFSTTADGAFSPTERMRITNAGLVGIGTSSPNAAALVELSSTTQGFLPPRMTTTQRDAISTPPNGLVLYNTTTDKLQVRAAGSWVDLH